MSTTISGDASSLPLPTASCVETKSTSSSTKGNTCSKILDIALAIVGALVVVAGVLALVLCASNVIFTVIGIPALIIGSACVGAGISRLMYRSSYASLEAKNVLAEQRLRNLSEEKDALASVSFINKMFLRGLTDDLQALEA
ncbi:candidate inclusion membrane protein [Chlamydia trachomatis]|nr:IncA protein [Chlamydia trachomatis L1/115]CRH23833.1 candidate inclusion membrane protein [Chlamydia trachomatis]